MLSREEPDCALMLMPVLLTSLGEKALLQPALIEKLLATGTTSKAHHMKLGLQNMIEHTKVARVWMIIIVLVI